MLESITVHKFATFTGTPQTLGHLSKLNFVYGCNGAGKTTLSKVAAMTATPPGCHVVWRSSPLQTFVYNRDFVGRNLSPSHQIKGIFTLGEATADILQQVEQLKCTLEDLQKQLDQKRRTLSGNDATIGKQQERTELGSSFAEDCWTLKKTYDSRFRGAFEGLSGAKVRFRDRLLQERETNTASFQTIEYLEQKAASVFAISDGAEETITLPQFSGLLRLEQDEISNKVIVGRSDVDIAAMIARLRNSDWVREGQGYFDANDEKCPFCQQPAPDTLRAQLTAYFDDAFIADTASLNKLTVDYTAAASSLHHTIQAMAERRSSRIDTVALASSLKDLDAIWRTNLNALK